MSDKTASFDAEAFLDAAPAMGDRPEWAAITVPMSRYSELVEAGLIDPETGVFMGNSESIARYKQWKRKEGLET